MSKLSSIKVSYENEFHIIAPVPVAISELYRSILESISELSCYPNLYFYDADNDKIRITTQKAYDFYLKQSINKIYIEKNNIPPIVPIKRELEDIQVKMPKKQVKYDKNNSFGYKNDNLDFRKDIFAQKSKAPTPSLAYALKLPKPPKLLSMLDENLVAPNFDCDYIKYDHSHSGIPQSLENDINEYILDPTRNSSQID